LGKGKERALSALFFGCDLSVVLVFGIVNEIRSAEGCEAHKKQIFENGVRFNTLHALKAQLDPF
jgi:hypothetical protein